jgi:hypothetical protein
LHGRDDRDGDRQASKLRRFSSRAAFARVSEAELTCSELASILLTPIDMRVTIAVHDHRTQKSFSTRAFPSGQAPGVYSAAVGLEGDTHWIHVKVGDKEAQITSGNKIASPRFELKPIHQSNARLVNGTAIVEYDVAKRYHILVNVQGTLH